MACANVVVHILDVASELAYMAMVHADVIVHCPGALGDHEDVIPDHDGVMQDHADVMQDHADVIRDHAHERWSTST